MREELVRELGLQLGWTLLHGLWIGAAVWAVFEAAMVALRRRVAQVRYVVGCAALVVMVGGMVGAFVWQEMPARERGAGGDAVLPAAPERVGVGGGKSGDLRSGGDSVEAAARPWVPAHFNWKAAAAAKEHAAQPQAGLVLIPRSFALSRQWARLTRRVWPDILARSSRFSVRLGIACRYVLETR